MSRIGKQPITIPGNVTVTQNGGTLLVKGPAGEVSRVFREGDIGIAIDGTTINFTLLRNTKFSRSLWGTYASHVQNMIEGSQKPYEKKLILEGVGFKMELAGNVLNLAIGFSHPVKVAVPADLKLTVDKGGILTIQGVDKDKVGQFAAKVRALKKPEPYKGKGFRYSDEVIRRKQGKKSA